QYHYRRPGDPILETLPIADMKDGVLTGPHIPRMHTLLAPLGINFPERLPLNLAFLLAILACVVVYVFLWKTKWGYELRAVGINASAAEYGGISIARNIVIAMCISGMLAGMVGINDVLGYRYRYYHNFSANYGFTGIAVALLETSMNLSLLAWMVRYATTLTLASLGGMFTERGGVINIALEGIMFASAFTAAAVTVKVGNPWIGIMCATLAGLIVALIHAV